MKNSIFSGLFFLVFVLTSCSENGIYGNFKTMFKLKDSLESVYPNENVNVKISNGEYMSISFVNSDLKELPKNEKTDIAKNVGGITKYFFPKIKDGSLTFVIFNNYIIYKYTEAVDIYSLGLDSIDKYKQKSLNFK